MCEQFHLPLVSAPKCPTLLTVHDMRPALDDVPPAKRTIFAAVLHRSLAAADHIITGPETMRGDISAFHPSAVVSRFTTGSMPRFFARAVAPR